MEAKILIISPETPREYAAKVGETYKAVAAAKLSCPSNWEVLVVCVALAPQDYLLLPEHPEMVKSFPRETQLVDALYYAGTQDILLVSVVGAEPHYANKAVYDNALVTYGVQAVVPFSYDGIPRRLRVIPHLWSAITVGGGVSHNEQAYGPGLELYAALPSGIINQSETAAFVAGRLATIVENLSYTIGAARQLLRQQCSNYIGGWNETSGFGKLGSYATSALDTSIPLAISYTLNDARTEVTFTWMKFPRSFISATVIKNNKNDIVFDADTLTATLPLLTSGSSVFYFYHRSGGVLSPTSRAAKIVISDAQTEETGELSYLTGRILLPTGEPYANIVVEFLPAPPVQGSEDYVSLQPVSAKTDADGYVYNLENVRRVGLRGGVYKVRIAGVDVYRISVPSNGGEYGLTALIQN